MVNFITKNHKKIPIRNKRYDMSTGSTESKPEEKQKDKEGFAKSKSLQSLSDKDLVKAIGDNVEDPQKEKYFVEIERRNQLVPHPKHERVGTVFRDDPNAIENMSKKVQNFQNEVDFWKKIIKQPSRMLRSGASPLGRKRVWALTNASTNLRDTKKKLDKLKSDKESGVKLERKTTYKGGKPRFYYKETKDDEK